MTAAVGGPGASPAWTAEVAALRALVEAHAHRADVRVRELPPSKLAPYAVSLAVELVGSDPDEPPASGRLVLLHDPAGQEGWDGDRRVVALLRADLDEPMARDPMLADVAWEWLLESLDGTGAGHRAATGTVTTTVSRGFGTGGGSIEDAELELRCSWSPDGQLVDHVTAYCDLLGLAAGVPPPVAGVVQLHRR